MKIKNILLLELWSFGNGFPEAVVLGLADTFNSFKKYTIVSSEKIQGYWNKSLEMASDNSTFFGSASS